MAEAVGPHGTAEGVDPSTEAITHARRRTRLANCVFSQGVAEALDAPDGSYHVVVSSLMVHHLPEELRPQALGEMFRVLRPGGSVLIAEFRPPTSRVGRRLVGALHAGRWRTTASTCSRRWFGKRASSGSAVAICAPWIHYLQAVKPVAAA
jgi:ubiquinone/menaquinone biosynthesis C-methylase UbiE